MKGTVTIFLEDFLQLKESAERLEEVYEILRGCAEADESNDEIIAPNLVVHFTDEARALVESLYEPAA